MIGKGNGAETGRDGKKLSKDVDSLNFIRNCRSNYRPNAARAQSSGCEEDKNCELHL